MNNQQMNDVMGKLVEALEQIKSIEDKDVPKTFFELHGAEGNVRYIKCIVQAALSEYEKVKNE